MYEKYGDKQKESTLSTYRYGNKRIESCEILVVEVCCRKEKKIWGIVVSNTGRCLGVNARSRSDGLRGFIPSLFTEFFLSELR